MTSSVLKKVGIGLGLVCVLYIGVCLKLYQDLATIKGGDGLSSGNTPAHFLKDPDGRPAQVDRQYEMPVFETVRFPSQETGKTLCAWWVEGKSGYPAIIVTHGYGGSKADLRVLLMGGMLAKHGYSVLMLDLRNHGHSDPVTGRTALGNTEYPDLLQARKWLIKHGISDDQVAVAGGSMGGSTALIAAYKEPKIRAVFSDSTYSDPSSMIKDELRRRHLPTWLMPGGVAIAWLYGDHFLAFSAKDSVKYSNCPIFLAHGRLDPTVSFSHGKRLAALPHPKPFIFWSMSAPGHCREILVNPQAYNEKLVGFFVGVFGK